ncbi:Uncharacterized protein TCM_017828 [Theobroma cacao]|uniref:Retrotransposon Copia-like N-terminal domain-containing protein n=1 Tax=Theobroma cacao TaxID=3641 RepID=A0A061EE54_THECC|nr:Uncharacterized protein TCM_017828 [Theobroma cacao]
MENTSVQKVSTTSIMDSQSLYFLHHTDHYESVVINHKLTFSNYVAWSRAFMLALLSWNKVEFIDRTVLKPASIDLLFGPWIQCNNLILAWLMESITPPTASTIFYMDSIADIWSNLKQNFGQLDYI